MSNHQQRRIPYRTHRADNRIVRAAIETLEERRLLAALVDYTIFVSVDGLRADAVAPAASDTYSGTQLSAFHNLMQHGGAYTLNARNDYDITETMPNHVSQMTARPVWSGNNAGHHWSGNNYDPDTQASTTIHTNFPNQYVASVFDEAHDRGAVTGLYVGKEKLEIFDTSYDAIDPTGQNSDYQMGRVDTIGANNTRDKIDYMPDPTIETNDAALVNRFCSDMRTHPMNFSLLHFRHPDAQGHSSGWLNADDTLNASYLSSVYNVDNYLDTLLAMVAEPQFAGRTAIILTADHGGGRGTDGSRNNHNLNSYAGNYTIPLVVWSPWSISGGDLYAMNVNSAAGTRSRLNPGTSRVANATTGTDQPIHHGDGTNLALQMLGMPAIAGSYWNNLQNLNFGTLQIEGSDAVDTINITLSGSTLTVVRNGVTSNYDSADYARIAINTYGGNDSITFGANVTQNAYIDAGAGDDNVASGMGNDTLYGGLGSDNLAGGMGGDYIDGGADTDTVDYSARTAFVKVAFDGSTDNGAPGEGDTITNTIEAALRPFSDYPHNLAATPVNTSGQTTVSWSGNFIPTDLVHIEISTNGTTFTDVASVNAASLSTVLSGLNRAFTYFIRAHARSSYNNDSAYSTFTLNPTIAPATPTGLTASAVVSGQSTLNWTGSYCESDTSYLEQSNNEGGTWSVVDTRIATNRPITLSGLASNTRYYFRVRVQNSINYSSYSNTAIINPLPTPASVSATPVNSSGQTTITWTGSYVPGDSVYVEYYNESVYAWYLVGAFTASNGSGTVSGLNPRFTYSLRVHAHSSYGQDSSYVYTSAAATQAPMTPTNLTATEVTSNYSVLHWSGSYWGGDQVHDEQSNDGINWTEVHSSGAKYLSDYVYNLSSGVGYSFRIRVTNSVGSSSYSNEVHIGPPFQQQQPAPAPSNLTVGTVNSNGTIQLSWTGPYTNTNYVMHMEVSGDGTNFSEVNHTAASCMVGYIYNLAQNTMYWFRVRASQANNTGYSTYSNIAYIGQNPLTPTNLAASAIDSYGTTHLTWSGNYDSNDTVYVERSTDNLNFQQVHTTYAMYLSDYVSGLTRGTTYYFRIRVYDGGTSSWSGYSNVAITW